MEQDAQLLDNNVTAPQCEHDAQEVNAIRLVRIQDESGDGRKTISKEEFQFRNIILLFVARIISCYGSGPRVSHQSKYTNSTHG